MAAPRHQTIADTFWTHVTVTDTGCWEWTKARSNGYGAVPIGPRMIGAHRLAWMKTHGPIPPGLCVCHNCPGGDNKSCINPAHLFLGTPKDNLTDAIQKGDFSPWSHEQDRTRGEGNPLAKLTRDNVVEIRRLWTTSTVTKPELGAQFGVTRHAIHDVLTRRTWGWV
jgi:hypothetical protein